MLRQIAIAALISSVPLAAIAQAQNGPGYPGYVSGPHTSASYPTTPPSAPQHHASTLQEGLLRGKASVMQAYYNGQLTQAQARILLAEARARETQLRVTKMLAAQERRRLAAAEREEQRQRRLEAELLGKQLNAARMPERYNEYRLSNSQLDRRTGQILWPAALRHPMFTATTSELQGLFGHLASTGAYENSYVEPRITELCVQLQEQLREAKCGLDMNAQQRQNYLACQRYVLGLKYEVLYGLDGAAFSLAAQ